MIKVWPALLLPGNTLLHGCLGGLGLGIGLELGLGLGCEGGTVGTGWAAEGEQWVLGGLRRGNRGD